MDDTTRRRSTFSCIPPFLFVSMLLLVLGYGVRFYAPSRPDHRPIFERETGFIWPTSSTVVSKGDSHGGFVGDGEFYVVLHADDATLSKLRESQPTAPLSNWMAGPVPTQIGYHCAFGTSGVSASRENGRPTLYSGHPELVSVLGSEAILYSAHERCCGGALEWHNGTLLILDPTNNKICLSVWDF